MKGGFVMFKIIIVILMIVFKSIIIYGLITAVIAIGISPPILFLIGTVVVTTVLWKLVSYVWQCLVDIKDWIIY
jgi:hypothetical protein